MASQTETSAALLERSAPEGCEAVQDLYSWSLNYDTSSPMTMFLDIIGWSDEINGDYLILPGEDKASTIDFHTVLGFVEIAKLGAAMVEYANAPETVTDYVRALMLAEMDDLSSDELATIAPYLS